MHVMHTLKPLPWGFDLQKDVFLLQGQIALSDGPDRAYLLMDAPAGDTVGLWLTIHPKAAELLEQVLALRTGPAFLGSRPWVLSWIRDGRVPAPNPDHPAAALRDVGPCLATLKGQPCQTLN